jgi:aminomethyltransferase
MVLIAPPPATAARVSGGLKPMTDTSMATAVPPAPTGGALRHTPLTDIHIALGAKMVPFAGYLMPVQYPTGITAEHIAVRTRAGLFDVSHMGEFDVRGPQALACVDYFTTNDVGALAVGQVQYSTILNARGTIEDDCLVYRFADHCMLVVNASNRAKDWRLLTRLREERGFACELTDVSDDVALLALQGPEAERVLRPLTATDLSTIEYYHFAGGTVAGVHATISRTGYTGEDGFELYVSASDAVRLWDALTRSTGTSVTVTPAGLGARDTLRLEMGMALYGNDIDDAVTPLEANLAWLVKTKKGEFVGRDALLAQRGAGVPRKLVGFTVDGRVFPRPGYAVSQAGHDCGPVRSGTVSPTLGIGIGTCYLPTAVATPGTTIEIDVRGKSASATVVKMPFYTKGSHK